MKNPRHSKTFALEWYIENRIEYLEKKVKRLRESLEATSDFDYDAIKELMETRGRLKELQHMQQRLSEMGLE